MVTELSFRSVLLHQHRPKQGGIGKLLERQALYSREMDATRQVRTVNL